MITVVVPAAGLGTRLGFDGPKALAPLLGGTLLSRVLEASMPSADELVMVVRPGDEDLFRAELERMNWSTPATIVTQATPTGSADAVAIGVDATRGGSGCVVVWADQVGVTSARVSTVAERVRERPRTLVLPLVELPCPYVWIELGPDGSVDRVGRQRDGDPGPTTGLGDLGLFGFPREEGLRAIAQEFPRAAGGARERDFVYVLPRLSKMCEMETVIVNDPVEAVAVNTRQDLARASRALVNRQ